MIKSITMIDIWLVTKYLSIITCQFDFYQYKCKQIYIYQQEFTKGYTLVFRILTTAVATLLGIIWFLVADLKEDT